jgi:hypothetical protein
MLVWVELQRQELSWFTLLLDDYPFSKLVDNLTCFGCHVVSDLAIGPYSIVWIPSLRFSTIEMFLRLVLFVS